MVRGDERMGGVGERGIEQSISREKQKDGKCGWQIKDERREIGFERGVG